MSRNLGIIGRDPRDAELALGIVDYDQTLWSDVELLGEPLRNDDDKFVALKKWRSSARFLIPLSEALHVR